MPNLETIRSDIDQAIDRAEEHGGYAGVTQLSAAVDSLPDPDVDDHAAAIDRLEEFVSSIDRLEEFVSSIEADADTLRTIRDDLQSMRDDAWNADDEAELSA